MNRIISLLAGAFFILSGTTLFVSNRAHPSHSKLLPKIKRIIHHNRANHAYWALTVRDTTGKLLQAYHSNKLMRPASNLKLLVSATALHMLGRHYRYKTPMYGRGVQVDSVWKGDIIIRGKGDPSISGYFYNYDRLHVFQEFYEALKARGIKKINGNLIGNDSYFDQKPYPEGWSWEDLSYYYAVPVNALSFNNNTVD